MMGSPEMNNLLKRAMDADQRIKDIVAKLEAAEGATLVDKAKNIAFQLTREAVIKQISNSGYYKKLSEKFFTTTPALGNAIFDACNLFKDAMGKEQLAELANIGNNITSLSYRMVTEKMTLKKAFGEFVGSLQSLTEFCSNNLDVAAKVGGPILEGMHPLGSFLKAAAEDIAKGIKDKGTPKSVQEGLMRGINTLRKHYDKLEVVLKPFVAKKLGVKNASLSLEQTLLQGLTSAIFPVGGAIINTAYALYQSDILDAKQRNELAHIGHDIISLPYRMLTEGKSLSAGFTDLAGSLKDLGNFCRNNMDIAVKAGATILENMHPLGKFLSSAIKEITKAVKEHGIPKNLQEGLTMGISAVANNFGQLENVLENAADQKLSVGKGAARQ